AACDGCDPGEEVIFIAIRYVVAWRQGENGKASLQIALAHLHQLTCLVETQRVEQHGIDDGEDGAIGAVVQCQGEHRDERESRIAGEGPKGIAKVVAKHSSPTWRGDYS